LLEKRRKKKMAINQITTSVSVLNSGLSGFLGVSLTNYETSGLSAIAAGSCVEIGGTFFLCTVEETINASSWTAITTAATAYLALTPSGTAGSQILTASWLNYAPVWSESKQGWYASAGSITRVIGSAYKVSATQQDMKYLYAFGRFRETLWTKKVNIGLWNMNTVASVDVTLGVVNVFAYQVFIFNDQQTIYYPLAIDTNIAKGGWCYLTVAGGNVLHLERVAGQYFGSGSDFNDPTVNRGYVWVQYYYEA
jgi:hypothetical protein